MPPQPASTAPLDHAPKTPMGKAINYTIVAVILLGFAYLAVCLLASTLLMLKVPISDDDMQMVSFLSPRFGLESLGMFMGGVTVLFGVLNLLLKRSIGLIHLLVGGCLVFATSEVSALRQGVLVGDVKIGCYSYEALECRRMLNVPQGEAQSIYRDPTSKGAHANWYEPIRAHAEAKVTTPWSSTLPGVAFLQSPFTLVLYIDELMSKVEAQRKEVTDFKGTFAK